METLVRWIDCAYRWVLHGLVGLLRAIFRLRRRLPQTADAVVVIRNGFFGDYVVAIPALRELRQAYPRARIILLTASSFSSAWRRRVQNAAVFEIETGLLDDVVQYGPGDLLNAECRRALRRKLKFESGPAVVSLGYSVETMTSVFKKTALCALLGLPFPEGLDIGTGLPAQRLLNRFRTRRSDILHQTAAALASVRRLLHKRQSVLPPLTQNVPRAQGAVQLRIGIAPFSKQPVKQWPLERFAAVINTLAADTDATFELFGAPEEREAQCHLLAMLESDVSCEPLCGALSLPELRRRFERLDLLLCLDSGPMHLASLLGVPTVCIFPQITLHQFWSPWSPVKAVLSVDVPCRQCNTQDGRCPAGTNACIEGTTVDAVLGQVHALLRKPVNGKETVA